MMGSQATTDGTSGMRNLTVISCLVGFLFWCNACDGGSGGSLTAPSLGSLTVTIRNLPNGASAKVTVTGPNGYSSQLTSTQTLQVPPGSYSITADPVALGIGTYYPAVASQSAIVAVSMSASVTVDYLATVPAQGAPKQSANKGNPNSLLTSTYIDEGTAAAIEFIRRYGQQIIDQKPPSEKDISLLVQAMLMTGDIEKANKAITKGAEIYPNSKEMADLKQLVRSEVETNQRLMDICTRLDAYQQTLGDEGKDYAASIAVTKSLVQSLSDILTGKTQVITRWTENGKQQAGRLFVGEKAVKEWVKALGASGVFVYSDTKDPDEIAGKIVGIQPLDTWPEGLREITDGKLKGAYTMDRRVPTKYGRDMFITVFPSLVP
jgi:hypothetical protein